MARAAHHERGEMLLGGQEQFYLEGQIAYAVPKDDDGMHVYCSTQHPTEMQHLVAHVLNVASHNVLVECRRMGGGFGGKESQSGIFACCAALAAWKLLCPVKLRPDRDDDMMITGKRHDFHYTFEVGYDDDGMIDGVSVDMTSRCGFSADLSGPVMTRAVCHFDNAYWLSDVHDRRLLRQDQHAVEHRVSRLRRSAGRVRDRIHHGQRRALGRHAIRSTCAARNLYGKTENNQTPYGQTVEDNVMHELIAELEETSEYRARRAAMRRIQREQRNPEEGPRADAGQVRHRVQRDALQPGGRARSHLHRRLDARESRRHRDGPGPEHEGRAGRRA